MKTNQYEVTAAQLNAAEQFVDIEINFGKRDSFGTILNPDIQYPNQLQIINATGSDLLFIPLTETEYPIYVAEKLKKGYFEIDLGSTGVTGATTFSSAITAGTYDIITTGSSAETIQFTIAGTEIDVAAVVTAIAAGSSASYSLNATLVTGSGNAKIKVEIQEVGNSIFITPDLAVFYADLGAKLTGGPFTVATGVNVPTFAGWDRFTIADTTTLLNNSFPKTKYLSIEAAGTATSAVTIECIRYVRSN